VRPAVAPLFAAFAVALAAGCGDDDANVADVSSLEGVPWVLVAGIDVEGWETAAPSASFEDGRMTGSTGCNTYGASYTLDGSALELGRSMQTLIGCPPPAGDVETAFNAALERVAAWRVEDDELVLLYADDEELLRFAAAAPVGSWQATGVLRGDALVSPIAGTEITATFSEGDELSGSAGCNTYRATYTSGKGSIEISPPASTKKLCPEPEGVMEQESVLLATLPTATRFRIDGNTLQLFSADGTRILDFTRVTG
jgi:heat shock protein HslJ